MTDAPPFDLFAPRRQHLPLVFNSPHSGRDYPQAFLRASRLDPHSLRQSEDCFVDQLFAAAPAEGAPLLAARFPRAYVDVNREPYELDPSMFAGPLPPHVNTRSARAAEGLGTIARIAGHRLEIYRHPLSFDEAEERIRRFYMPYHARLRSLVERTAENFGGAALLIDCHSMPSRSASGAPAASDIVLGDRFAAAANPDLTAAAAEILSGMGWRVELNRPYAGGFITRHYGRPQTGVHAIQVEINRALYMDENRLAPHHGFDRVQERLRQFIRRLAARAKKILPAVDQNPL